MFDFGLSEEERLIQETASRFAQQRLLPRVREHERVRGVSPALLDEFRALGLDGVDTPASAGGSGIGSVAKALVLEELAAVDPGAALALDGLGPAGYALVEAGAGPPLARPGARGVVIDDAECRFRSAGQTVAGEHPWVAADQLDVAVLLQPERALVVTAGFQLTPIKPCGLEAAGASRLALAGAPLAATIGDAAALTRARARTRLYVAALLVGAARGAHHYAMRYAGERIAFGRPIAHHQALAFLIADMATAVDAARVAVWRAAAAIDRGEGAEWEAASALAEAAEQALFIGPNAVQILGGHGFMKDHPVEKWMRDIRTLAQLGGGREEAELTAAALAPAHAVDLA